jgi:hypothetical protein
MWYMPMHLAVRKLGGSLSLYLKVFVCFIKQVCLLAMGDHGFVLICSGIPGDCDALYFLQEEKPIFSFLGNIFWLKCNYTHTKKLCYILNYIFMCFFAKNYKIVSSNLKPRVRLGRQASKNEINKSKPWAPIVSKFGGLTIVLCTVA